MGWIVFLFVLNLLISWWNAYVTGRTWDETKRAGGLLHLVNWCGWLQSAFGFSWCILLIAVYACLQMHVKHMTPAAVVVTLKLGYLVIGGGLILSGVGIWIDSLVTAWKTKRIGDIAVAGWNSYAEISNVYHYASDAGGFVDDIAKFFKSDDEEDNAAAVIVLALVIGALVAGFVLAQLIFARSRAAERRRHALELKSASA